MLRDNKGFTLVEIIVVLVILAILAAIMVPSLTGFIDRAKEQQTISDARQVSLAASTGLMEWYAVNTPPRPNTVDDSEAKSGIEKSMLPLLKSECGMEKAWNGPNKKNNTYQVITSGMSSGKWSAFCDDLNGGNKADFFVDKAGYNRISGMFYMSADKEYAVRIVYVACTDFPEAGVFVEKMK